jgi:hypothetical protein
MMQFQIQLMKSWFHEHLMSKRNLIGFCNMLNSEQRPEEYDVNSSTEFKPKASKKSK